MKTKIGKNYPKQPGLVRGETFGLDPGTLTPDELKAEIAIHKKSITEGTVGTPNVYVRLADLEQELKDQVSWRTR